MPARVDHVLHLAREAKVRGAILYVPKFCEPELFYVPVLRSALDAAGIRTLVLEGDIHLPLPQRVVTRIQALLETLR